FITYILALASPKHGLQADAYAEGLGTPRKLPDSTYVMELAENDSFAVDLGGDTSVILPNYDTFDYMTDTTLYGLPISVGSLDTTLMEAYTPFLVFDPRGKRDTFANYFINHMNLVRAVRRRDNEQGLGGFSANVWGAVKVGTDSLGSKYAINPAIACASYAYCPSWPLGPSRSFMAYTDKPCLQSTG